MNSSPDDAKQVSVDTTKQKGESAEERKQRKTAIKQDRKVLAYIFWYNTII